MIPGSGRAWRGVVLAVCATAWLALLALTPVWRAPEAPPPLRTFASLFHAACGRICHQQASRSWSSGGVPWPVCVRCTGLYAGAVAGAWFAALGAWRRRAGRPARRAETLRVALLATAGPTVASWGLERVGWVEFSNIARFALAIPLGALVGWILVSATTGGID